MYGHLAMHGSISIGDHKTVKAYALCVKMFSHLHIYKKRVHSCRVQTAR